MWEILYADDTLLLGKRARELNILLQAIEKHSSYYNLRLNKEKCEVVQMNGKADIHFSDGIKLKTVEKATYLGGIVNANASRADEINSRISKALSTCSKLKEFFKKNMSN